MQSESGPSPWIRSTLKKLNLEYNRENALMLLYLPDDVPDEPHPDIVSLLPWGLQEHEN